MAEKKFSYDPNMEVLHLRTFLAVAELGSINKASEKLFTAQPALSRHIRLLEEALDVKLFARHGSGMAITRAGELLLEQAAGILDAFEQTKLDVANEAGVVSGRVTLGVPPTVGIVLATSLAERYCREYPRVALQIIEEMTGFLLELLQAGRMDLAVLYNPKTPRGLRFEPLHTEELYLVGSAESGLSLDTPVSFQRLAELELVLPSEGHTLREMVMDAAAEKGVSLRIRVEADSFRIQKELVERAVGHTVLPFAAVHKEVGERKLSAAPISEPKIKRRLVLATRSDRPVSQAAGKLKKMLKQDLERAVESGVWPGRSEKA
jgi:LysR family nitrogen assimilation transcriptional regulator